MCSPSSNLSPTLHQPPPHLQDTAEGREGKISEDDGVGKELEEDVEGEEGAGGAGGGEFRRGVVCVDLDGIEFVGLSFDVLH